MIVKLTARLDVTDAYVYAGHLFAVFADGRLRSLDLQVLYEECRRQALGLDQVLKFAVLRNDWFGSEQVRVMLQDPSIGPAFLQRWRQLASKSLLVEAKTIASHWRELATVGSMPVYDLRMYAMRAFVSHRHGVDEVLVGASEARGVEVRRGSQRVFEGRALEVAPRWGGVAISADSAGLFHGSLSEEGSRLMVGGRPVQPRSIRSTWANFDLVNYRSRSEFSYLCNRHEKLEKRAVYALADDEPERKIRITEVGAKVQPAQEFLRKTVSSREIAYAYNSNTSFFCLLNDGRVQAGRIKAESNHDGHISRRLETVGNLAGLCGDGPGSFLPSSVVVNKVGSHLEFLDRTLLMSGSKVGVLHPRAAYVVKVFPTSRRFQATTIIVDESGVNFYVMLPPELGMGGPFDAEVAGVDQLGG